MNVAIIFAVIILVLFVLSYITKRRFSVLGLALAAGSILSTLWAQELTPVVRQAGFNVQNPPLITIVSILLVLLPAVVLLFSGPSYRDMPRRIIGAVLFASLAFALLIEPLGIALTLEDQGKMVYDFFVENRVYIITVGLVIAIIDLLSVHTSKAHKPEKH